jgi:long-chain fatty acid transport protein
MGMQQQTQATALNWVDRPGFRFGAEYRLLEDEKLALRVGAGYDLTPVPTNTLSPLAPDANRVLVSAGIGWRQHGFSADVGYLAVILTGRTGTNPDVPGFNYSSVGHVVGISLGLRLEDLFGRLNQPDYK